MELGNSWLKGLNDDLKKNVLNKPWFTSWPHGGPDVWFLFAQKIRQGKSKLLWHQAMMPWKKDRGAVLEPWGKENHGTPTVAQPPNRIPAGNSHYKGMNYYSLEVLTWPLKISHPKSKVIFQPSFFRGYVKVRGCKGLLWLIIQKTCFCFFGGIKKGMLYVTMCLYIGGPLTRHRACKEAQKMCSCWVY